MSIEYEQDGRIVTITIKRPEVRNALDLPHFSQLAAAWRRFRDDDSAWVAIVTGVKDVFFVGADLKSFIPAVTEQVDKLVAGDEETMKSFPAEDGMVAVLREFELNKPVIAAVNGICVAGGMELLCGCDLRLATPSAVFGVVEPKRGLFAGGGTTVRLPRQTAFAHAMEMLLMAERISAQRAVEIGIVNAVVSEEELLDEARSWAERICVNAPLAVRATKESVMKGLSLPLSDAYRYELECAARVFSSEDALEGPRAFAEKRDPVWSGR